MSTLRQSNELQRTTSHANARQSADIIISGAEQGKSGNLISSAAPYSTRTSFDETPSGAQTPTPLLTSRNEHTHKNGALHSGEETYAIESITRTRSHMGDALENLYKTQTARSQVTTGGDLGHEETGGLSPSSGSRGRPVELSSLTTELIFVLVCSSGQLFFSFFQGNVNVNQQAFRRALGIQNSELPWMVGSYLVALGLSVILSGSLSDLMPPRLVVVVAFVWLTIWNIIGVFSLTPDRATLFFFMRAMQGLSVGVIVSGSMSILGRVYAPGLRKTRVFSAMAAMAPFGFWLGAIQGGALTAHLPWIFGSNAILCALCAVAAYFTIPALRPVADLPGVDAPTIRDFDWKGAILATAGCVCLLFGLTQGTITRWSPYTYALIIVGALLLAAFFFVEHRVHRPLIPNSLWKTTGFAPLMAAYFLGFGGFVVRAIHPTQRFISIGLANKITTGRMAVLRYAIFPQHTE
jgi:MFS family permease